MARVNHHHPQTDGKLERFHGEIQRKQKWFKTIGELVHWYNNHIKPHMSLTGTILRHQQKRMQERCHKKEQELLMSRQENSMMWNKGRTDFGIQHEFNLSEKLEKIPQKEFDFVVKWMAKTLDAYVTMKK